MGSTEFVECNRGGEGGGPEFRRLASRPPNCLLLFLLLGRRIAATPSALRMVVKAVVAAAAVVVVVAVAVPVPAPVPVHVAAAAAAAAAAADPALAAALAAALAVALAVVIVFVAVVVVVVPLTDLYCCCYSRY